MFSKSADPTSAPPIPARSGGSNVGKSVLGQDLKITGEVVSSGVVEVLGEVEGNLSAETLTIGNDGRISGAVRANSIEVKGRLDGRVDSESFAMRSSAQVVAEITYSTLVIESGARIEGRFSSPKA
ncbi:MAG: polymer-forming cytoskeletal protein [Rhodobacteraceae bacterium]|jgi:cytoskeletal protein CcmA (bactofilin family)|nr:polymer-forming cytoskeletal protein [Paracoccaceae bacterium]